MTADPLAHLAALPGVPEANDRARTACEGLRWHEAFRRRAREVRAEATVQQARHGAAIDGARVPTSRVRALLGDPRTGSADEAVVRGALRGGALVEGLVPDLGGRAAPALPPLPPLPELLARLHTAVGAGWLPDADLGRPRTGRDANRDLSGLGAPPMPDEVAARLDLLAELVVGHGGGTNAPALVTAAVVHGELLALRPFVAGNGLVARAAARLLVTREGLDPTGAAVPEVAWSPNPHVYVAAAAGFVTGTPDGVARWIVACADALVTGAAHARTIADAVLSGTTPPD